GAADRLGRRNGERHGGRGPTGRRVVAAGGERDRGNRVDRGTEYERPLLIHDEASPLGFRHGSERLSFEPTAHFEGVRGATKMPGPEWPLRACCHPALVCFATRKSPNSPPIRAFCFDRWHD